MKKSTILIYLTIGAFIFITCKVEGETNCPQGEEGCPCADGGVCEKGLTCEGQWESFSNKDGISEWNHLEKCIQDDNTGDGN